MKKRRFVVTYCILGLLTLIFFCLNICMGSVSISLGELTAIVKGELTEGTFYQIVTQIRLPRAIAAGLLGGALALSGYLLQTFFHNPIAGPFTLGISSGAKLMVALCMVIFLKNGHTLSSPVLILAAFLGALLAMGFVLLAARSLHSKSTLIVSGVMIGYICSAVTDIIVAFADDSDIVNLHNWSKGSFSGISWEHVRVILGIVLSAFVIVFLMSKEINAYQYGEGYAANMGLNLSWFRTLLVILSSILAGCVTAFAGPVSFVGVAVPTLVRRMLATSRPLLNIPACFLGGMVFCLFSDLWARVLFAPTELSISTVTAVFGAPVVILILLEKKQKE